MKIDDNVYIYYCIYLTFWDNQIRVGHRYWKGDSASRPFCFSTMGRNVGVNQQLEIHTLFVALAMEIIDLPPKFYTLRDQETNLSGIYFSLSMGWAQIYNAGFSVNKIIISLGSELLCASLSMCYNTILNIVF